MADNSSSPAAPANRCAGCGIVAPATETNYTLISSRHGWRLSITSGPDGKRQSVWRCPSCWAQLRKTR